MLNKLLKLSEKNDDIQKFNKVKEKIQWGRKQNLEATESWSHFTDERSRINQKVFKVMLPGYGVEAV